MSGFLRRDENAAALQAAKSELAELAHSTARRDFHEAAPAIYRQRYECTCGWHASREEFAPPSHIRCARCAGVAVGRGPSELV